MSGTIGERSCKKPCRRPNSGSIITCNVNCPGYIWDGETPPDSMVDKNKKEYRVVEFYNTFFAHSAYKLQKKVKFWKWSWWETIEEDNLGIHPMAWANKFNCPIIKMEG